MKYNDTRVPQKVDNLVLSEDWQKRSFTKKSGGNKAIHHTVTEAGELRLRTVAWAWVAWAVKSSHYHLNEIMFSDKTLNVLSCFTSRHIALPYGYGAEQTGC